MSRMICMWSGPRNLSTAMMRSFDSRSDCAVWDEPFFAPFLAASGKEHPGREETLASHDTDPRSVAKDCAAAAPNGAAYYFQKHMPHHMLDGFTLDWAKKGTHFFLIRHPSRVINSYAKGREHFDFEDLGYAPQMRLFKRLIALTGAPPPIVDCDDILRAPESVLSKLCEALNMPWDEAMLSWKAGPRETDGAWAPHWYASVERSTKFALPPNELPEISEKHRILYKACLVDYQALAKNRLTA